MENKKQFVKALGEFLGEHVYRLNIKKFEYLKDERREEFVLISFNDGFQKKIRITGNSELAILLDVAKRLS